MWADTSVWPSLLSDLTMSALSVIPSTSFFSLFEVGLSKHDFSFFFGAVKKLEVAGLKTQNLPPRAVLKTSSTDAVTVVSSFLKLIHRRYMYMYMYIFIYIYSFYVDVEDVSCQSVFFFFFLPSGPPVNVTCNIFINSFGSITETTMVRRHWRFQMSQMF